MQELVFSFLTGVLGTDGARALRKASDREPALESLLVPRAALAWLQQRGSYEGHIPGVPNTYFRMEKTEKGYSGSVTLAEGQYVFTDADLLHIASALAVGVGIDSRNRKPVRDRMLVRLGKSIDALVKSQQLFKSDLRNPDRIFQKRILDPKEGYKISHEHHDLGNGQAVTNVNAHDFMGNHVGHASFKHHGNDLMAGTVVVDEEHRRKGIASAMYTHAQRHTGKTVIPSKLQTQDGQALHEGSGYGKQFGKVEPPGQSHKPQQQQGPLTAEPPQKQPAGARPPKPKLPKMPALKVEKSDADRPCGACGGKFFKSDRFVGCLCFRDLSKGVRTTAYGDGYVLEFGTGFDRLALATLQKALRGGE